MKKKSNNKMTRRTFLKAGLAAGGAAATGLRVISPRTLHAEPKEVKIGLLAPLTGPAAYWGEYTSRIFGLAATMANEQGGIKSMGGAKIRVVTVDTETKTEVGAIQAEKLIADKDILMITGCNSSPIGMAATQAAERNRTVFITGTDMLPEITTRGFQYTYRTCALWSDLSRGMVYFARDMGQKTGRVVKKMATLSINTLTGVYTADEVAKAAKEVGFEVVDQSTYDPATTKDFTGYISKYKNAGVNLLIGHNTPQDGISIIRTMKELNFNPYAWGGIAGFGTTTDIPKILGKLTNYLYASTGVTDVKSPAMDRVMPRYRKDLGYNVPDPSLVGGFAVIPLLRAALEKNPTYDREAFKNAIDKVGTVKVGEYDNLQFEGIKFDAKHDNMLAKAFIVQWWEGAMNCVAPEQYAVKKPVWPRPAWDKI